MTLEEIDIVNEPVPQLLTRHDVEICGHQCEFGVIRESMRLVVIDWRLMRGWIGSWMDIRHRLIEEITTEEAH